MVGISIGALALALASVAAAPNDEICGGDGGGVHHKEETEGHEPPLRRGGCGCGAADGEGGKGAAWRRLFLLLMVLVWTGGVVGEHSLGECRHDVGCGAVVGK